MTQEDEGVNLNHILTPIWTMDMPLIQAKLNDDDNVGKGRNDLIRQGGKGKNRRKLHLLPPLATPHF